MNAGIVFAFHSSIEGTLERAGGNAKPVSEFLLFKRYSEAFDHVFIFSADSKSYDKMLPGNCRHIKLINRPLFILFGWLVLLLYAWRYKFKVIRLISSPAMPTVFLTGKLARAKVILKYYYLWYNTTIDPVKRDLTLKAFLIKKIEKFLLYFVDYVIAGNKEVEEFVGDERKMLDINEGIITDEFDPGKVKEDGLMKRLKGVKLIFVGRLNNFKDPVTMLRGYGIAKKRIPDLKLVVCGDGDMRPDCERLADKDVHFLGFVGNVPPLLRGADIYVITSVYDASPRSLMEAMCMGLPCIATRVGGIPEYLPEDCGVLIEPGNPGLLAEKIVQLAKNREMREGAGKRSRERILKYHDLEKNLDKEIKFLTNGRC